MHTFDDLVAEAATVDVSGWDFSWLDGRATEARPPWGYANILGKRLPQASSALDLDTGGGEIIAGLPVLPPRMTVTETWPTNLALARLRLEPRGVTVVATKQDAPLPFADASFDLVTSRHPVDPDWTEIARVLVPSGTYLAQHVGSASAVELIEYFIGPYPAADDGRDPYVESRAAAAAGLTIVELRTARCRMEFYDIGAVVYILRKCVWWVPDFSVDRYAATLRRLDALIRADGVFVAHSTRHLIEAVRQPSSSTAK